MHVEVEGVAAHEEDSWVGRDVRVGGALVHFHEHVGRCIVTSRDPDTGIVDVPTLELLRYRRPERTSEPLALGIYGEVREPGAVSVGEEVLLRAGSMTPRSWRSG
jgi:uncharacterized protein YcbX